jgi:ribose transport system substrate-binding protein
MHKKITRLFLFYWPWLLSGLVLSALLAGLFLPLQPKPYPYRIIAIGKASSTQGIAFWYSIAEGMAAAASEFQVTVDYRSPADESEVDRQIAIVYQAIAEKPDAIIQAALDADRLVEPARAARAAGITVVMVDSALANVEKSPQQSFVATNNVLAGEQLGNGHPACRPGARILVVSPSTRGDSLIGRETAVRAVIEDAFDIMPTLDTGGQLSDDIYQQVSQALVEHPDVKAIVCLNEYTTAGSARAIRGAGLTRKVTLVGFDSSEELIDYLEEGLLSAVVIQRPSTWATFPWPGPSIF